MDDSLEIATGKINALWAKADDYQATLGQLMARAHALVEAGDKFAAGMNWNAYAAMHFKKPDGTPRSIRGVRRFLQIGRSDNPEAKAAEIRAANAEANRRHREPAVSRDTAPDADSVETDPRKLVASYMVKLGVTIEQMVEYFDE